jgi:hypothetical protein
MANDITAKSSIDDSIKEAQRFGASVEEARLIHNLVQANTAPTVVRNFELKFGPDSVNNRAVWINLFVEEDLHPSKEKISELNKIAGRIRSLLLREKLDFWPYVEIRGRS